MIETGTIIASAIVDSSSRINYFGTDYKNKQPSKSKYFNTSTEKSKPLKSINHNPLINANAIIKAVDESKNLSRNIIRTSYTEKMKENLEWLAVNHEPNEVDSIHYYKQLVKIIIDFVKLNNGDPFASFLLALNDALREDEAWINTGKDNYGKILKILVDLNNTKDLKYPTVYKAVNKLRELNLNVTPY